MPTISETDLHHFEAVLKYFAPTAGVEGCLESGSKNIVSHTVSVKQLKYPQLLDLLDGHLNNVSH